MHGELNNKNWLQYAEFFKDVNDWFDCMNVRVPVPDTRDRKKAYSLSMEIQNSIMDKMTETMNSLEYIIEITL